MTAPAVDLELSPFKEDWETLRKARYGSEDLLAAIKRAQEKRP
jgi:hypothetical protein